MTTHNTHFTDYKILEADSAEELSGVVVQAIHNRWQPYGGMTIVQPGNNPHERLKFLQPMVQQAEWIG